MTKPKSPKTKQKIDGQTPFFIGLIMLVLTFMPKWLFENLASLLCEKTAYGGCEMSSGIMLGTIAAGLTATWVLIGVAVLIYGAVKVLFISRL